LVQLPSNINIDSLIDNLRKISWEAYDILIYYSQMLRDPNKKSNIIENQNNDNPVTLADLKVNELIIKRIREKYKNINWEILSEENEKIFSSEGKLNSDWIWILDPLDGTKDFIQGTGNYAMHLALNYKNKPYIGIVLIPEKNELWISTRSRAWCETRNQELKSSSLLKNKDFGDMILATSKNHRNEALRQLINLINFKKVSVIGSVGCKVSSILRGESDIYISLSLPGGSAPKDWDFAAPAAILVAAGGAITNLDNEELTFNKNNFEQRGIIIASSNKKYHLNICSRIKEIIREYDLYPLNA
jgi:3'(2'), 5'-bisphosphate nucleotidase